MATPGATILNIGSGAGQNHYQLDYSATTGGGIVTKTQAQLTTFELASVYYTSDDGSMCMLRSDVDVDVIASNGYPRTEHRELATDGTTLRAFNPLTNEHWCQVYARPIHLPPMKPSVVIVQMHDNLDDVIEIAVQPRSDFATTGKLEVVGRINGTSVGVPKLVADYVMGDLIVAKIRVGAIASGSAGWELYCGDLTTPKVKSTDAGMPAMNTSGTNSYFKWGCYLQTKWVSSGTGGLETDRNEYGLVGYRECKTFHTSETAPLQLVFGTDSTNAISNVRWGTKAAGHQTVTMTGITMTPGLPASLAAGDMMFCLIRASRGINTTGNPPVMFAGIPSSPSVSTGWDRILTARSDPAAGAVAGGTQLVSHNVRFMLWAKAWEPGDAAPTVTYPATATLTDTSSCQVGACAGAKWTTVLSELIDQLPNGYVPDLASPNNNITGINYAAASSTTVIGPTDPLAANARGGALAIAMVTHETNATTGGVAVVTGTDTPALTWAEGGEGATVTITPAVGSSTSSEDEPCWANDWALVPAGAGQPIVAKQAAATISNDANKPNNVGAAQAGKGWGVLFTIAPANKRATGLIRAAAAA